jgi:MOSC domain-containing protein YiiM
VTLDPRSPLRTLTETFPRPGRVEWIGVRPARRVPPMSIEAVRAIAGCGLEGDHRTTGSPGSKRQVTVIQREHLAVLASLLGRDEVTPDLLRRNIVVSGINLIALKDQRFTIGDVVLEGTGPCVPCSRMESNLGPGGYNAMRGHGGINARVLSDGVIRIGVAVAWRPMQRARSLDLFDAGATSLL